MLLHRGCYADSRPTVCYSRGIVSLSLGSRSISWLSTSNITGYQSSHEHAINLGDNSPQPIVFTSQVKYIWSVRFLYADSLVRGAELTFAASTTCRP